MVPFVGLRPGWLGAMTKRDPHTLTSAGGRLEDGALLLSRVREPPLNAVPEVAVPEVAEGSLGGEEGGVERQLVKPREPSIPGPPSTSDFVLGLFQKGDTSRPLGGRDFGLQQHHWKRCLCRTRHSGW